jgi:hypothetical protein
MGEVVASSASTPTIEEPDAENLEETRDMDVEAGLRDETSTLDNSVSVKPVPTTAQPKPVPRPQIPRPYLPDLP